MKRMIWTLALALLSMPMVAEETAENPELNEHTSVRRIRVDCDRGRSIQRALDRRGDALLIEFRGTCQEEVLIRRDDVTLRGVGRDATLLGGIKVQGASRVQLEGFVSDGAVGDGIELVSSQDVHLTNLSVQNAGNRSIAFESASAVLTDVVAARPFSFGILAAGSNVTFKGSVVSSAADHAGFLATRGSVFNFSNNVNIEANDSTIGIVLQMNSSAVFADGVTVTARNNRFDGMVVVDQATVNYGVTTFIFENNGIGLLIGNASWAPFIESGPSIRAANNLFGGIEVIGSATATFTEGTEIVDNGGFGLLVSDSTVDMINTTSHNNAGPDCVIEFAARVSFDEGNVFGGPILCDDSVHVRGSNVCGGLTPATSVTRTLPNRIPPRVRELLALGR